jgi:predicted TIM-barrel enzyme
MEAHQLAVLPEAVADSFQNAIELLTAHRPICLFMLMKWDIMSGSIGMSKAVSSLHCIPGSNRTKESITRIHRS